MRHVRGMVVLLALALGLAACGSATSGDVEETPADAASEAASASASDGEATVSTAETDLGEVLVDGEGRTLYRFLNDSQGTSTCTGECLATWPILPGAGSGAGAAEAAGGVDAALLGTADNPEAGPVVTYDGWPLYTFAGDAAPGDVNGQGVGEVWYVVAPDGSTIETPAG